MTDAERIAMLVRMAIENLENLTTEENRQRGAIQAKYWKASEIFEEAERERREALKNLHSSAREAYKAIAKADPTQE